jgi:hypothetical protein
MYTADAITYIPSSKETGFKHSRLVRGRYMHMNRYACMDSKVTSKTYPFFE